MNLKQLFCRHIWQITNKVDLNRTEMKWTGDPFCNYHWLEYNLIADYEKCLKCDKERIVERRYR